MHRDKLESSTGRRKKEDKERQRCLETRKEPENVAREYYRNQRQARKDKELQLEFAPRPAQTRGDVRKRAEVCRL